MHVGGSGHNGGEKRNVLIVSVLLSMAIYFAQRDTRGSQGPDDVMTNRSAARGRCFRSCRITVFLITFDSF